MKSGQLSPQRSRTVGLRGKIYVPGLGKGSNKFFSAKPISNIRGPKLLHFTSHSRVKMRQYGLSEARVKRVMHSPKRIEEGIAPKTVAMMQRAGNEKHPHEIWIMLSAPTPKGRGSDRSVGKIQKVISAWRYPGITKPGEPLPEEILKEMRIFRIS